MKHRFPIRRIMAGFLFLILPLLAACASSSGSSPVQGENSSMALHVDESGQLVNAAGEAVQLHGVSTHGISWFPQYLNANAFRSVQDAGGNVVRAAMYTDTDSGYLQDPENSMLLMQMAIENARSLEMYIIVDWHILSDGNPNEHLTEAITFFDAVASRYGDDPHILYEICNEPNGTGWEDIKQYAYAIFPVIRQYAPNAVILLGTPDYSSDLNSPLADPFPGENFLYTYHAYAGEHMNPESLRRTAEAGLPIFVSEWGIGSTVKGTPALEEAEKFLQVLEEEKISWCAWSLCNKEEAYSMIRPDCTSLGGWQEEDLTEVGRFIFRHF